MELLSPTRRKIGSNALGLIIIYIIVTWIASLILSQIIHASLYSTNVLLSMLLVIGYFVVTWLITLLIAQRILKFERAEVQPLSLILALLYLIFYVCAALWNWAAFRFYLAPTYQSLNGESLSGNITLAYFFSYAKILEVVLISLGIYFITKAILGRGAKNINTEVPQENIAPTSNLHSAKLIALAAFVLHALSAISIWLIMPNFKDIIEASGGDTYRMLTAPIIQATIALVSLLYWLYLRHKERNGQAFNYARFISIVLVILAPVIATVVTIWFLLLPVYNLGSTINADDLNSNFQQNTERCSEQPPDDLDYLEKICRYVKDNNIDVSPADPAKYKIKSLESGQHKGRDVIIVNLDCCYLGDRVFIDLQTQEIVGFSVGAK